MTNATHHLLACKGCGSAIVESAFALAKIPLDREEVDYGTGSRRANACSRRIPWARCRCCCCPTAR
jgi:hypothetical protein